MKNTLVKKGNKFKIRSFKSLRNEFGINQQGNIKTLPHFTPEMQRFCGHTITIDEVYVISKTCTIKEENDYIWPSCLLEADGVDN